MWRVICYKKETIIHHQWIHTLILGRSHLLRCQAVSLWRHHVAKGIVNLWSGLNFQLGFLLGILFILSSCPMSLQAWGCAPLRWFLKPWVPTWPPLFDGCFVVSGQLLAEDEQHMMIIASQLDILKVPLNFWPGCPLALHPWMSYSEEEENITYCAPAFQPLTLSATLDNQCSKIHRLEEHKIPAILSLFGLIHHL